MSIHINNQPTDLTKLAEKQPNKIERILQALTNPKGLNRFQAEALGCHCLNSTVSALQNKHGVIVASDWEEVPTSFGGDTRCKRYWISPSNLEHANKLLERWAKARVTTPTNDKHKV